MAAKEVHTSPSRDGWVNTVGRKIHGSYVLKADAVLDGKKLAQSLKAEHVIHLRDGRIGAKNSYGNDRRDRRG